MNGSEGVGAAITQVGVLCFAGSFGEPLVLVGIALNRVRIDAVEQGLHLRWARVEVALAVFGAIGRRAAARHFNAIARVNAIGRRAVR